MFNESLKKSFDLIEKDETRKKILDKMEERNICLSLLESIRKDKFLDEVFCAVLKNIAIQFHLYEIGYLKFNVKDSILCDSINKKIKFSENGIDSYFFEKTFSNIKNENEKVKFIYEIIVFLCSERVSSTIINYLKSENKNILREDIVNNIETAVLYIRNTLKRKVFEKNTNSEKDNSELLFLKFYKYISNIISEELKDIDEEKYKSLLLKKSVVSTLEDAFKTLYGDMSDKKGNNSQFHS